MYLCSTLYKQGTFYYNLMWVNLILYCQRENKIKRKKSRIEPIFISLKKGLSPFSWGHTIDPIQDWTIKPNILAFNFCTWRQSGCKQGGFGSFFNCQRAFVGRHVSAHISRMNVVDGNIRTSWIIVHLPFYENKTKIWWLDMAGIFSPLRSLNSWL